MFLLNGLPLFLDAGRKDSGGSWGENSTETEFPSGRLTSTAWEGWWHEDAAQG